MKECTLGIVKPDAYRFTEEIMLAIERAGLKIVTHKTVQLTAQKARRFYWEHRKRDFFEEMTAHMASGPITTMVIEGDDAVTRWRELMGPTDPDRAGPETIRRRFGTNKGKNAVHGSDSNWAAVREIDLLFPELSA